MRPITVTVGNMVTAASATAIRTATTVAAGDLVLNGAQVTNGIGLLEADRNLLVTFAGAELGLRLLLEGYNTAGYPVSETIIGPAGAGTVLSVNQYRRVTRGAANQASLAAVSIGTSAVGTSAWVNFDGWSNGDIAIQASVSGAANYTVQSTLDNPNDIYSAPSSGNPASVVWVNSSDTAAVGAAGTIQSNFLFAPQFARILLNSGTGLVTATFAQSGAS